jgi:hypothetical protein
MPYRIRWEGHGVYRRFYGVVTAMDFEQANEEMTRDLRYQGARYIIADYLDAEASPDLSEASVEQFAKRERLHVPDSPDIVHASVATDENIVKHLRYFGSRDLAPYPFAVFSTIAEARAWIASNPRPGWRKER